jgi:hypothetical protein
MINAAVQNAFSLAKLTNEPQINMYRLRECWIEKLGLDLIIDSVQSRYDQAVAENWSGRRSKHSQNLVEFLEKVNF